MRNDEQPVLSRRQTLLSTLSVAAAATITGGAQAQDPATSGDGPAITKNRINQTICAWCYSKWWKLEQLCQYAVKLGFRAIDLLEPTQEHLDLMRKYNLTASMIKSHSIPVGFNRKENWEKCSEAVKTGIDFAAANGFPNVICFSGNRKGMSDEEGLKNCAEGLKPVVAYAEQKKVTVNMELLNSRVNHKDYMCDKSDWGVALCKAIGSDRFKLLFDIYHMQIDEGDIIATIRRNHEYFGHYHTGGVPGRNEIDDTQELNYPAIMRAIVETGYKGWVGQEFIPKRDPLASLTQAAKICDV
jgi:hydroxypyruvate isomerase